MSLQISQGSDVENCRTTAGVFADRDVSVTNVNKEGHLNRETGVCFSCEEGDGRDAITDVANSAGGVPGSESRRFVLVDKF
ncbi:MAG: hypothetical protein CMM01_10615 [Rhodopirellula sp.]|nr:hypothetical protein [Rhodopirellula sp.]MAI71354.1 hypothetical protein [Rhodopirellula sp.]